MLTAITDGILAIWSVFKSIQISDIIDIAILSYLIFHGIKLIRETKGAAAGKGHTCTYCFLPSRRIL